MVELVKRANEWREDVTVKIGSLPEYMAAYKKVQPPDLRVVKGEMRHTSKDGLMTDLYGPILSARSYLKTEAFRRELGFFLWTEPFCTLAWATGADYPRALLDLGLKLLLENEAHDSIGGCALDKIHRDVMHRFSEVAEISDVLLRQAIAHLAHQVRTGGTADDVFLLVYNSLPQERSEVATVAVEVPRDLKATRLRVFDDAGQEVPVQAWTRQNGDLMVQQPADIPVPFYTDRFLIHFAADRIPALGYRLFRVAPEKTKKFPFGTMRCGPTRMENEALRVTIRPDGTFDLEDKVTGQTFEGLHVFESSGEVGDPWNRKPPLEDRTVYSSGQPARITLLEEGPLLTRFQIELAFRVPASATQDSKARTAETVELPIRSVLTLRRGARRLDVETTLNNTARDHRLRVLFATKIAAAESAAAMPFTVERRPIVLPDTSDWVEPMLRTHPHRHFVDVSDGEAGLALISEGLQEYEVSECPSRVLALTLLRAFQQRNSVRGIEYPDQKDSQCPGELTVRYALCPHRGDWREGALYPEAFSHNVRLKSFQCGYSPEGTLPTAASFLALEPADLVLSGVKRSENGKWLVVRFSNPTDRVVEGQVKSLFKLAAARLLKLNEQVEETLKVGPGNTVAVTAAPGRIVTLALEIKRGGR
jgi:mannosylglycerate hydrolase